MSTNHKAGKDPTPQGRTPQTGPSEGRPIDSQTDEGRYLTSEPGPDAKKDGVWFYGRKKRI